MIFVLIVAGLALLALGGELIVRGGVGAARRLDVSPVIIGVVLMGFGTSAPELVTSVQGALAGAPGLSLGNIVGSNIANILLIAGLAAVIAGSSDTGGMIMRDGPALAIATGAFALALWLDMFTQPVGFALLAGLVVFLWISIQGARRPEERAALEAEIGADETPIPRLRTALTLFTLGLFATLGGATLLVDGAVALAREFGLSEALIGVTIVAVGTSLPEVAATIAAALRGHPELALGNVLGSNIFNILGVAGVTAAIVPLPVPPELLGVDLWVMLGATVLLLGFAGTRHRLSRWEGVLLLGAYVVFLAYSASKAM